MKLVIAGSRHLDVEKVLEAIIDFMIKNKEICDKVTEIISGGARGADHAAQLYARKVNLPFKLFEANWNKYRKSAGHIRNAEMAQYGDQLLLVWDGVSKGSLSMKQKMQNGNKQVYEVIL